MKSSTITKNEIQIVLDLFLCSNDNRLKTIVEITGYTNHKIITITSDFLSGKIKYQKPNNLLILHS